jgi:hypothetical protein
VKRKKVVAGEKMRKLSVFLGLAMVFPHSGCNLAGVVPVLGTPTRYEKKIPPEYDLAQHEDQKILVLVNQPGWLGAQANLRYYLTEAINEHLTARVKVKSAYLVGYEMGEMDYYRGFLAARTMLVDVGSRKKVWPKSGESKTVKVGFEMWQGSQGTAVTRLAASFAHCTVRYFYGCTVANFKIPDDRSGAGWEDWGE